MTVEHTHAARIVQDVVRCPGCKRVRLLQIARDVDHARHQLELLLTDRTETPQTTTAELGRALGAAWRGFGAVTAP